MMITAGFERQRLPPMLETGGQVAAKRFFEMCQGRIIALYPSSQTHG
jgi:hypothetical protein